MGLTTVLYQYGYDSAAGAYQRTGLSTAFAIIAITLTVAALVHNQRLTPSGRKRAIISPLFGAGLIGYSAVTIVMLHTLTAEQYQGVQGVLTVAVVLVLLPGYVILTCLRWRAPQNAS
jgi:hypothetical protein